MCAESVAAEVQARKMNAFGVFGGITNLCHDFYLWHTQNDFKRKQLSKAQQKHAHYHIRTHHTNTSSRYKWMRIVELMGYLYCISVSFVVVLLIP